MSISIKELSRQIIDGQQIDKDTVRALAAYSDKQELFKAADEIRRHFMGDLFHLCSIINAKSGNCTENCRFCAQSARHHTGVETYTLIESDEALAIAKDNDNYNVHRLSLVTSGRNLTQQTVDELAGLYEKIDAITSMQFCASSGMLTEEIARALVEKGVSRYHCNLEANRDFFPKICTTHTWEEKVETLKIAQAAGMSVCSGGIIGLGESMEDRISLAFELREIGVKSIPINILTPIPGTPLAEITPPGLEEVLTVIALFRFINPQAVIRMAGGRQQLGKEQYGCFAAGANGAIVGNYLTTTGSGITGDLRELSAMGFTFGKDVGNE